MIIDEFSEKISQKIFDENIVCKYVNFYTVNNSNLICYRRLLNFHCIIASIYQYIRRDRRDRIINKKKQTWKIEI